MEKRTIIWEENTEPPKNYFWVKPDNKVYEFNHEFEEWLESETISYTAPTRDWVLFLEHKHIILTVLI